MTKTELIEIFDQFAKSAIKEDTDGYYLYGSNVHVAPLGAGWDVCLCNQKAYAQDDMTAFLGTGKLNNLCNTLPDNVTPNRLDGEAWFHSGNLKWLKSWLLDNRKALAIKKRVNRVMTEAQIANLSKKTAVTAPV